MQDAGQNDLEVVELRCFICNRPLDNNRRWRRGLDGEGAHEDCLEGVDYDEEEASRGNR